MEKSPTDRTSGTARQNRREAVLKPQQQKLQCDRALKNLGEYLREYRTIVRRQTQAQAAREIGVSRLTLIRMEQGSAAVKIGQWVAAWAWMGQLGKFETLTNDPYVIAEATARALVERGRARREAERKKKESGG